jgi:hypothetical protein
MERKISWRIEATLDFDPRIGRGLLVLSLLLLSAGELASENVTMTTYYPAPSGVYTQMIVTNNAYLARDSGSVGIGTAHPAGTLDVEGSGNVLLNAGNVGIGTASPASTLDVEGKVRIVDGTQAAGLVLGSDASGNASWGAATYAP